MVRKSDLLTMKDFEGVEMNHHNSSSFEILLQVASVATKKFDSTKMDNENVELNLGKNGMSGKRSKTLVKEKVMMKMKPLKFVIKKQHNEEQKLTSYVIKASSKIHDESNDVKTKTDEVLTHESLVNGSQRVHSRKTNSLKRKREEISNEEWIKAMEMKRKKKNSEQGSLNPPRPPNLPEEFETKIMGEYGGTRIIRVIQKSLSSTDVSRGHSRVSIPCSQVESFEFLEDDEMTLLRKGQSITVPLIHKPRRNGIPLPLMETSLEFGQWDLHKDKNDIHKVSYQYLLRTNWNTIVSRDELKQRDTVQVWAFRSAQRKLCMALVEV